jgi:4-amino-4-deoxy-L-arabinose transferase-like glycosyltransferase
MALAVFAAGLDWGLKRWKASVLAIVVAFNPVVMSELTTYLVDGIMIGFLVVAVAVLFSGFKRPQPAPVWAGTFATIVSINAKFTGLVFLCFVFAAGWVWCAVLHRKWLVRYTAVTALALVTGVLVFGYNPYITNTIHRGHPFYPVLGTAAFPSLTQQKKEGIELYETPKNLLGHSRFYRLAYATFGRPGNAPYRNEPNAQLMWPFAARTTDLFYYRYHETRLAGFGPYFSGALIIGLGLWGFLLFQRGRARWAATLVVLTIVLSLSISLHLWWPRYGPQLWLLPAVPALFAIWQSQSGWAVRVSWALLALLAVNAAIVAGVRINWETNATRKLRGQLAELSQQGREVEIALDYFEIPVGERLKTWGVRFQKKGRKAVRDGNELMSVVEGYPGAVKYRLISEQ